MIRKNSSSDKGQELNDLIASYETAKANNRQVYMDGDQLADIADKYATERRFEDAQEVITYGLELHPGHTDLLVEQAYLYLDTMQFAKAKNVAECINETYESEVKLLKAEILLTEGKLEDAEKELESIEEKDDLKNIIDIAYLYIDMDYPEKALPWLTRGYDKYKEEEEFLAVMADCYRSENEYEQAIDFYNRLIDKNPYNPTYWTGLAKCHFDTMDFAKAIEACDFALTADENFGEAHTIKAHSLLQIENNEDAIEEYSKALQCKSLPPDLTYMFIGLAYTNMEKWERSFEYYGKALKSIPNENSPILVDLYSGQAKCLSKLGKLEEAHLIFEKAKKIIPDSVDIYLQDSQIYLEEDKFDEAKECWRHALNLAPEPETLVQIGNFSLDYGMVENARQCFEQAREDDPDYPGINGLLATVCMILRDHKAFYKYNQLSESPLNLDTFHASLLKTGDRYLLKDLEKFIDEVKECSEDDKKPAKKEKHQKKK